MSCDERMEQLCRQAAKLLKYRFAPGMVTTRGDRVIEAFQDGEYRWAHAQKRDDTSPATDNDWPDLSDPATLGCLLAQVEGRWGCTAWVAQHGDHFVCWLAEGAGNRAVGRGSSKAEALVAALECAERALLRERAAGRERQLETAS